MRLSHPVRSIGSLFALLTMLFCVSADASGQEWQWISANVPEGTASGWYRWAIDPAVFGSSEVHLMIVSDSTCSVHVNGQRVLRHSGFDKVDGAIQARGIEIRTLLRNGRNQVAVELQSEKASGVVGIAIQAVRDAKTSTVGGGWKSAKAMPPVGWQQTDFNDRDWPELKPVAEIPVAGLQVKAPGEFAAPVVKTRVRNTLPFVLEDGDHVALVGATFVERAQLFEHLEATLAGTLGSKKVTFRNLGWSADTAFAESRGIFDRPDVGYLRMVEHIRAEEPTVAILCYGQNEALTAGMTPENFAKQFSQLIDELTASGIPCVVVSPHELFPTAPPIPSPARFNSRIRTYSEAAGSVAQSHQLAFVDMFTGFQDQMNAIDLMMGVEDHSTAISHSKRLTDNGMHLNDRGYAAAALVFRERFLGARATAPVLKLDVATASASGDGVKVVDAKWADDRKSVTLTYQQDSLSPLPVRIALSSGSLKTSAKDGEASTVITHEVAGKTVYELRSTDQYNELRSLISRKNEQYFHRWRPQNITYLFGFRKHEQGNNAADIARFDPFIRDLETRIHETQTPKASTVTLELAP